LFGTGLGTLVPWKRHVAVRTVVLQHGFAHWRGAEGGLACALPQGDPRLIGGVVVRRMMVLLSAAVLAVSAGVALSLTAPPAHAATPTQLTNLRFSWMGGLLQKTQVKYVTVSLTLVDPDGIEPVSVDYGDESISCPCVVIGHVLRPVPTSRSARVVHLHLASGTNTNGVWTGRFAVGAADAGFWRPTRMAAGDIVATDIAGPGLTGVPAPRNQVTVNVRGYDWPRAWLGTPVKTGANYVVRGGVGLSRSAVPVAGLRLEIRLGCEQFIQNLGAYRNVVRTSTRGLYAYTVTPANLRSSSWVCAAAVAYPTDTYDSFVIQSNLRGRG
jgi:hypothetical protein